MRSLLAVLCASGSVFVATALAEDTAGKRAFEAGVASAQAQQWEEAREHFEVSLAEADRPATRFNLILAYDALGQPLEVVRHALTFLAMPEQSEHAAARARAQELLVRASARLAVLEVGSLPPSRELFVDGLPPKVREERRLYLAPGRHQLELRRAGEPLTAIEIELMAGEVRGWPLRIDGSVLKPNADVEEVRAPAVPRQDIAPASVPAAQPASRTRVRAASTLGGMGAAAQLAALGTYVGAVFRADAFGERDLSEPGVGEATNRNLRLQNTIMPLAFVGGVLLASPVLLHEGGRRRGSLGWATAALVTATTMAGAGLTVAFLPPPKVPGTNLDEPRRQAGGLLAASALPLFAYGFAFLIGRRRSPAGRAVAVRPLGVTW